MYNILSNIGYLSTCSGSGGQADLGVIRDAAIVWSEGKFDWIGKAEEVPDVYRGAASYDANGRLVIPGLVDCHTHLAFGGWRTDEFEMRALGRSYLDIAKAGGGIASTVSHTRLAAEDELYDKAEGFLSEIVQLGVTTIECKSGYGLTVEDEFKLLRVYKRLAENQPIRIVSTLLAAHIVPAEYADNRAGYVNLIIDQLLPQVASEKLAAFCDVFVEETAFSEDEAVQILTAAANHGIRAKLHVDQLGDGGGGLLAARCNAISADHLEYVSKDGIQAMHEKDVVAVSLPFASFNLRQPAMPARACIEAGVKVAVATDFNPGSAPSYHLPAAMYMACIMQHMSPAEVTMGATRYAAHAISMENQVGQIKPGFSADFAVIDARDVNSWLGHLRPNACLMTVIDGDIVYQK